MIELTPVDQAPGARVLSKWMTDNLQQN